MARINWSGTFVVSVTPFQKNGEIDVAANRELIESLIQDGIDGIVLAGSTGEWFTMSDDERIELFALAHDVTNGRIPLLAGISAISTDSTVRMASAAKSLGLDGALLLPPPYVLPTDRELEAYVDAVADVGLPIMLYNNPARTGINLDSRWLTRFLRHESIVAVKESSKDIHQLSAVIRDVGDELAIFTGMETYLAPTLLRGGAGVVAMAPNVLGKQAIGLYHALKSGDLKQAAQIQSVIDQLYARMYSNKHNPYVVLKEGMRLLGRPGGYVRPPLLPFTDEERAEFAEFLNRVCGK